VERDDPCVCPYHDEWNERSECGYSKVDRVEANGIKEVEPGGGVMDRVESPEKIDFVRQAMDPVEEEFSDYEGDREVTPKTEMRGPE